MVVEAVLLIPVAMLVLLLVVQMCLWAHADAIVQEAAAEGAQTASEFGGSVSAGLGQARSFLSATAPESVVDPVISATASGTEIEVRVTAKVQSVIPGVSLGVTAVRNATIQEFRSSE